MLAPQLSQREFFGVLFVVWPARAKHWHTLLCARLRSGGTLSCGALCSARKKKLACEHELAVPPTFCVRQPCLDRFGFVRGAALSCQWWVVKPSRCPLSRSLRCYFFHVTYLLLFFLLNSKRKPLSACLSFSVRDSLVLLGIFHLFGSQPRPFSTGFPFPLNFFLRSIPCPSVSHLKTPLSSSVFRLSTSRNTPTVTMNIAHVRIYWSILAICLCECVFWSAPFVSADHPSVREYYSQTNEMFSEVPNENLIEAARDPIAQQQTQQQKQQERQVGFGVLGFWVSGICFLCALFLAPSTTFLPSGVRSVAVVFLVWAVFRHSANA
jgi:hypothetical protein